MAIYANGIKQTGGSSSGLPSGGTTGQILAKKSEVDGDFEWRDAESLQPDITEKTYDGLQTVSKNLLGAINEVFQSSNDAQTEYEATIIGKGGTVNKSGEIATKSEIIAGIESIEVGGGSPKKKIAFSDFEAKWETTTSTTINVKATVDDIIIIAFTTRDTYTFDGVGYELLAENTMIGDNIEQTCHIYMKRAEKSVDETITISQNSSARLSAWYTVVKNCQEVQLSKQCVELMDGTYNLEYNLDNLENVLLISDQIYLSGSFTEKDSLKFDIPVHKLYTDALNTTNPIRLQSHYIESSLFKTINLTTTVTNGEISFFEIYLKPNNIQIEEEDIIELPYVTEMQNSYENVITYKGGNVNKVGEVATKDEIIAGINSIPIDANFPVKTYYYLNGNECEYLTGGWDIIGQQSDSASIIFDKLAETMYLEQKVGTSTGKILGTKYKIDVTNLKYIVFNLTSINERWGSWIGIWDGVSTEYTGLATRERFQEAGTGDGYYRNICLDVSEYSGEFHVVLYSASNSNAICKTTIKSVYGLSVYEDVMGTPQVISMQSTYEDAISLKGGTVTKVGDVATMEEIVSGIDSIPVGGDVGGSDDSEIKESILNILYRLLPKTADLVNLDSSFEDIFNQFNTISGVQVISEQIGINLENILTGNPIEVMPTLPQNAIRDNVSIETILD